jgi:predicted dehydrogenase
MRPPFFNNKEEYGNTFMWVGIHPVDLILWFTGEKIKNSHYLSSGKNSFGFNELSDCAVAILEMENGVLATVTVDFLRDEDANSHGDDRIRIVGDKGILEVCDEKLFLLREDEVTECELLSPPDVFYDFIENLDDKSKRTADDKDAFNSTEAVINITSKP